MCCATEQWSKRCSTNSPLFLHAQYQLIITILCLWMLSIIWILLITCPSKQATFLGTLALHLHFHGNFTAINSEYVTVWANFKLSILNQSLGCLILLLTRKEIRTQQIKEILHGSKLMIPISHTLIVWISKIGCFQGILLILINQERQLCDVVMKG